MQVFRRNPSLHRISSRFLNQVITIEPGVYIPSCFDCPERFQGIGFRIEDEVLITESGYEVLTASIPKEIKHLESLLNNFGKWERNRN